MKTKLIIIGMMAACALVVIAQQRDSPVRQSGLSEPDATIISKLTEIVSIRERLAKDYGLLLAAGRVPAAGLAEVELAEARIELALERGQPDEIWAELKGLVAAHERRVERVTAVARDGGAEADGARAALLEAEVRLLRARK
jgi:hypothetical protein